MDIPPQRVHTTLPPARASARDARRFVGDTLRAWDVPDEPRDTACLLTTELVTNAVLHTGSEVELALQGEDHVVRVEVSDSSAVLPTPRPSNALLGTTGRGLTILSGLASRWGVMPRTPGKSVWFELRTDGTDDRPSR